MTGPGGHFDEKLQDFLDGRLTSEETKEVESHLNQCQICRLQFDALKKAKLAAAAAAEILTPSDLHNKILDTLDREDDRKKNS